MAVSDILIHIGLEYKYNVLSRFMFTLLCVYIYIYIYILTILLLNILLISVYNKWYTLKRI